MTATLRSPFNLSAHLRPTIGDQKMSYVGVDHMGWLLCDGRSVSRTTYALLFNVIGTTFGSTDATTFMLPDFRGCVPGMAGLPSFGGNGVNDPNPTSNAIGSYTGEQRHILTVPEMPTHNHGVAGGSEPTLYNRTSEAGGHDHGGSTGNNNSNVIVGGTTTTNDTTDTFVSQDNYYTGLTNGTHTHSITAAPDHYHLLSNQGGSNYHNNMQPTLFAGNMFMYSGRNMDAYFPYTWVGGVPAANATPATPGNVLIF